MHFPSGLDGVHFNGFNPAIDLEWPVTTSLTAMTGAYRNSYRSTSFFAAAAWTPWAWRLQPGGWRWLVAGLVSGYSRDENRLAPAFAAGLLQVRDAQTGIGVNLIGMPRVD